jgi:hypothetical protein
MTADQKKLLRDALVEAHLHYLTGKELAALKSAPLSAGVKRWEATAAAVEYAEAEGLV